MAPKKSKKQADKDLGENAKNASIATNEDELRKRTEEAEAQLREEAKIIERMTRDNKSKQEQINAMELRLLQEAEKHDAAIRILEEEKHTQRAQATHEIETLRARISELELHVEAYDVIESANVTLRDQVNKLMQQLEDDSRAHAEEIQKIRLDTFNHKMALEKAFRKALQEMDADYLKKAFNAMSEESKNALVANAKLKDELHLQRIGVDNLMQRFTHQSKHFQKMKVENGLLEQESQLRIAEVTEIKRVNLEASKAIESLKDKFREEEQGWKEQMHKVVNELRQDNLQLRKLYELGQKRCQKWKSRCVELSEREAKRRQEEHRAHTAPSTAVIRAHSTPTLPTSDPTNTASYDEMWRAKMASTRTTKGKTCREGKAKKSQRERALSAANVSPTELHRLVATPLNLSAAEVHEHARPGPPVAPIVPKTRASNMDFNFT